MPCNCAIGLQTVGFHPQRLRLGLDPEPPRLHLPIEDWNEFCTTARALGGAVVFYEAEPFAGTDLPVGRGRRSIWDVLPEAAWLKDQMGEIPTATYYVFFVGGVLEFQQETAWWSRTDGLWEKAQDAVKALDQQQHRQEQEAFVAELQRILPEDEAFRQIALLPRPPITAMRRRIGELFPDQRFLGALNVVLHDLAQKIKAEEKEKKKTSTAP